MTLVIIESPYAGDIEKNTRYARAAMRDSLLRSEYPLASHLLYTQPGILMDEIPAERELGIRSGLAWGQHAGASVVYVDLGITPGMQKGIDHARGHGRRIIYRHLTEWL